MFLVPLCLVRIFLFLTRLGSDRRECVPSFYFVVHLFMVYLPSASLILRKPFCTPCKNVRLLYRQLVIAVLRFLEKCSEQLLSCIVTSGSPTLIIVWCCQLLRNGAVFGVWLAPQRVEACRLSWICYRCAACVRCLPSTKVTR